jgi:hypothetical protein
MTPWIATACGLAMTNNPVMATTLSVIASVARQSIPEPAPWTAAATWQQLNARLQAAGL